MTFVGKRKCFVSDHGPPVALLVMTGLLSLAAFATSSDAAALQAARAVAVSTAAASITPVANRELLQEIEVPGLTADGVYKVVVEAISSPCPFTGVMAHSDATIPYAP
jgi:hypothetical protein